MRLFKSLSEFNRNVLTLITGTTIAQAIPIAISPILTRIYTPEDFGIFAVYAGLLMILGSIATFKYELAINLPLDHGEAFVLFAVSIIIACCLSLLLFVALLFLGETLADLLGNKALASWLYLLPLSVLLVGVSNSCNYWFNRNKEFNTLSKNRVVQSSISAGGQLSFSSMPIGSGLIVGFVIGQIASVIYYVKSYLGLHSHLGMADINQKAAARLMSKYRKFPRYQVPSSLIESSSAQMPVFLLGVFFNPGTVGFYSLSQRVIRLPIGVIARSIGEVFRQKASAEFATSGDVRAVFRATLKKLIIISSIPFLIFGLFSPQLFVIVFGENWLVAGEYAQIMTPLFWMSFVVGPLSIMFMIAEKQEYDLVIQILLIVSSTLALLAGYYYFDSAYISIALFTIVYLVKYTIELLLSYRFCVSRDKLHG